MKVSLGARSRSRKVKAVCILSCAVGLGIICKDCPEGIVSRVRGKVIIGESETMRLPVRTTIARLCCRKSSVPIEAIGHRPEDEPFYRSSRTDVSQIVAVSLGDRRFY